MKIVLVRGIPASGKSTWARKWAEEDPQHRVRICRDDIRKGLGKYWVTSRETLVKRIKECSIYQALDLGYDIVIDDMNLNESDVQSIFKIARMYDDCEVEFKDFLDVPLSECIRRDKERENPIGAGIITSIFNKYKDKYNLIE